VTAARLVAARIRHSTPDTELVAAGLNSSQRRRMRVIASHHMLSPSLQLHLPAGSEGLTLPPHRLVHMGRGRRLSTIRNAARIIVMDKGR
jgi:hypothetical protein